MEIFAFLADEFPNLLIEKNFSFAKHTTIGCGGRAAVCVYPQNTKQLARLTDTLNRKSVRYCFLGTGANVLARDGDWNGVAIKFSHMDRIRKYGKIIIAEAGVTGGALLCYAREHSLGGFEFLTGIPTSLGGATTMNAGIPKRHLSDVVEAVTGVLQGKIVTFSKKDCLFSEKSSVFQSGIAVCEIALKGYESSPTEIRSREKIFSERRKSLPKGRSMGCIFVNPQGCSAGALIEQCKLKGKRIGGAYISPVHANFIINDGSATAEDIFALIALIKQTVFARTGIPLREEIKPIP